MHEIQLAVLSESTRVAKSVPLFSSTLPLTLGPVTTPRAILAADMVWPVPRVPGASTGSPPISATKRYKCSRCGRSIGGRSGVNVSPGEGECDMIDRWSWKLPFCSPSFRKIRPACYLQAWIQDAPRPVISIL